MYVGSMKEWQTSGLSPYRWWEFPKKCSQITSSHMYLPCKYVRINRLYVALWTSYYLWHSNRFLVHLTRSQCHMNATWWTAFSPYQVHIVFSSANTQLNSTRPASPDWPPNVAFYPYFSLFGSVPASYKTYHRLLLGKLLY